MKTVRLGLSVACVALLAAGYCASVVASMKGESEAYARSMDQPVIRGVAIALLILAIVFAGIKDRDQ